MKTEASKFEGFLLAFLKVLIKNKVLFESEMIEVRAKPHKILSQVIQHVLQKLQGKSSRPQLMTQNFSRITARPA